MTKMLIKSSLFDVMVTEIKIKTLSESKSAVIKILYGNI